MSEWGKFDWFLTGFVIGCFWRPVLDISKKIYSEAKIATEEWNKSGKSN